MSKNVPILNSCVIQMTRKYPFCSNQPQCLIKYSRNFNQNQYLQLRSRIQTHSKLQHNCLIKIIKAYQSKKNHYFDIFYQKVPYSLRDIIFQLRFQELVTMKQQLINFCTYLIYLGIYPVIADQLLGVTRDRRIKLFLDVDYMGGTGNYQNLIKAKNIQIFNIFRTYEEIAQRNINKQQNSLIYSSNPYVKQQTPTILNVQYNVHHNSSPSHQQYIQKQIRNLRQTKGNIRLQMISGLDSDRNKQFLSLSPRIGIDSPVPTTNFSGAASKISDIETYKSNMYTDKQKQCSKPYRQNKFERKFSTKSIPNREQIAPIRLKSESLRHTLNNQHKQKIINKKQQLRVSFDRLSSKLARLQLALGDQKGNEKEKLKQIKKEQMLKNIKTGRMHLQEMDNVVSQEDNQQTKLEMNTFGTPTPQSPWKNLNPNKLIQVFLPNQQKSAFQKIYQKVKKAIDKTERTFKIYQQTKNK